MLGSTVAVIDSKVANGVIPAQAGIQSNNEGVSLTGLTLFGEGGGKDAFFTGKPQVEELGYTFLFRNYRSGMNKWQTADPLGYPDGFNNFAYVNNGVDSHIDPLGLTDAEDYFWGVTWVAFITPIRALALMEYGDKWNYKGFLHWLTGGGDIVLPWNNFDNKQGYMSFISDIRSANYAQAKSIAKGLKIGAESSFSATAPSRMSDTMYSHNAWISGYNMSITNILDITVRRTSQTTYSYNISAKMKCFDIADFNPGQSFGPSGVLKDDWFIYLKKKGWGVDYTETAESVLGKTYTGTIPE